MAQGRIWLVAAAMLAFGGGVAAQPSGPPPGADAAQPAADDVASWDAAKRDAYNASFDRDTHDACVSSALGHGAQADAADRFCGCVVSRLQPLSVEAKVSLSQHPDVMQSAAA
ncbi:MAG TPA: hypothetical protein VFE13_09270, partial [Caulobacteraceae bacterium]|nr:hypothetical protein [Caulobacteraceae bacterium]